MKILVKTFILLGLVCFLIPSIGLAKTQAGSSYQDLRDYLYGLLAESQLDEVAFTQAISTEAYGYNTVDKVQNFWHSLFFNNPRGSEVLYNDIEMSLAIGFARLGQPSDLVEPLQKIISRRLFMYHGVKNNNHYIREYAALASLAYLTNDKRLTQLQAKVQQSIGRIYLTDGYAYEGPEYGLYSASILSGYVYFTEDALVKQKLIDNLNWLARISADDGTKPPFDDSLPSQLPKKISAFAEINKYWQPNFNFYNIPEGHTFNQQESIWRYDSGATIWIRHRDRGLEWLAGHRHFSNGDVLLKQNNQWWLVAPGYPGWENKFNTPELHNVAISNFLYRLRSLWRFLDRHGAVRLSHEEGEVDNIKLSLAGDIQRTVESDGQSLVVIDRSNKTFKQFWQINGELISQQQEGGIIKLQWRQGEQVLYQELDGVHEIEMSIRYHTTGDQDNIAPHVQLLISGKDLVSRFSW